MTATTASHSVSPVAEGDRSEVLDALRAFALLGILISHVPDFTGYSLLPAAQRALLDPLGVDPSVSATLVLLIREKFVSLFSLLFGIGFAVQLDSAERRDAPFRLRFGRRLAALFVLGAAHTALWYGDILKDYAVFGVLLLLSSRWPVRRIAIAAIALLVARLAWPALIYSIVTALGPTHGVGAPDKAFADGVAGLGADPVAFLRNNLQLVKLKALQMVYEGRFLTIPAMFYIGALVGRLKLYLNITQHRRLLVWAFLLCGAFGVLADTALIPFQHDTNAFPPTHDWVAFQSLVAIAAPALAVTYASGFALLWIALDGRGLRRLAPIGRTALTNYISQTLLCTLAFEWLGLGAHLGAVGCLVAALAIFTVQCVISTVWLKHFRFGPLEWAWRSVTYLEAIDIRRRTPLAGATAMGEVV